MPKYPSTRARAILVYEAVGPWTVPQEEKAARASSMLPPFLPASKSQAGTTVQLMLELSLLWMNW